MRVGPVALHPEGHEEITGEGRRVRAVEGDFGSQHKSRRGGVTGEGEREPSRVGWEREGGVPMNQLVVSFVVQMSPGTVAAIELCDWWAGFKL